jgi:probable F420-dependent oxidoreductase
MKFGVHLPHSGPAASAASIQAVARHAESLGYADIWVSDHLAFPQAGKWPPSAYILEPLVSLTWAAAATEWIGLGTSVLVLPLRPPVLLAKMLASLDLMSGGRLIVGAACGWLEEEFAALGVPFEERGVRTDETLDLMRRCWTEDPVDAKTAATGVEMDAMRVKPQPERHIPIWVGGHADAALRRAVQVGDGWHGGHQTPEKTREIAGRLRAERPEPSFTLSMRASCEALRDAPDVIARELDGYAEAGIQHILAEPVQRTADEWMRSSEAFAKTFERMGFGKA